MTKETLAATLIGKSINPLTVLKTPAERGDLENEAVEIREISGLLLAEWKKLLVKRNETPVLTKSPPIPAPETPMLSTHSSVETSFSKMEESKVKTLLLPEGRTLSTGNKIRDPLRKTLVDIMQTPPKVSGEPFEEYDEPTLKFAAELALEIEDAIYTKFKDNKAYADKARSILFNLKDPKNPKLRSRILNGFLTPIDVVISDAK
jgi:transcription elongation factor S-II